jgi:hypothetical protein
MTSAQAKTTRYTTSGLDGDHPLKRAAAQVDKTVTPAPTSPRMKSWTGDRKST